MNNASMLGLSINDDRESTNKKRRYLLVVLAAFLTGWVALAVDAPISQWCGAGKLPGDVEKFLHLAETFAHGAGVAMIILAMFILDPVRRFKIPRLVTMTLAAGLAANLVKLTIARSRPRAFDFDLSIWDSFQSWFPLASAGSAGQSLPSAHTTTAFAFAVGLVWAYPRGRVLFPTLAVLAACQRIAVQAHFLSDVCWGIALGSLIGFGMTKGWLSPSWLDRWEKSLARRQANRADHQPGAEPGEGQIAPDGDDERRAA